MSEKKALQVLSCALLPKFVWHVRMDNRRVMLIVERVFMSL